MKGLRNIFLISCVGLTLVGCATGQQKFDEAISTGVYAQRDSIKAGRFDLVKQYNDKLVRVVPPPKHPIKIQQFTVKPQKVSISEKILPKKNPISAPKNSPGNYVILPPGFENQAVIVENSPQYLQILNENLGLKQQVETEKEKVLGFEKQADEAKKARDADIAKAKRKSWISWIFGLLGFSGIIGLIALMVFAPAAIPVITGVIGAAISIINSAFKWIASLFKKPNA